MAAFRPIKKPKIMYVRFGAVKELCVGHAKSRRFGQHKLPNCLNARLNGPKPDPFYTPFLGYFTRENAVTEN
jgi:hypothetical protein